MKFRLYSITLLVIAGTLSVRAAGTSENDGQGWVTRNLASVPLAFTKNMGQWDERVLFRADVDGATMWITGEGVWYRFNRRVPTPDGSTAEPDAAADRSARPGEEPRRDSIETMIIKAAFVGANPPPAASGKGLMDYTCNYFIGKDPSKWRTNVPNYEAIVLGDVYPGVNLTYYSTGNYMEYDFVVSPGADYSQIRIAYEGARSLTIDDNGDLVIETAWGSIIEKAPTVYQEDGAGRTAIAAAFQIIDSCSFGFYLDPRYDGALAVVIDPGMNFSTYLGGSDGDWGQSIAVDAAGSAYVTGWTESSDFPLANPADGSFSDYSWDAFVTKLSPTGNSLVYSTYLGGSGGDEGLGITVDGAGSAYITGETGSTDFPVVSPFDGSLSGTNDVFVTKLAPAGDYLVYSTYLGGSIADPDFVEERPRGIAVDWEGNAYVTGYTACVDFPTVSPFDDSFNGEMDAFVTKLSPTGSNVVFSTFLGGWDQDIGAAIAVDAKGSAYVTGWTYSDDFPTANPFDEDINGGTDAFVAKLKSAGNALTYSTLLGGNNWDGGVGIAIDGEGCAYVTGFTSSTNFPTQNAYDGSYNGGSSDAFVTKVGPGGSDLVYSTYLGGSGREDMPNSVGGVGGIAVDGAGCAFVTGFTSSADFPVAAPYDGSLNGNDDVFIAKLNPAGDNLAYSTYLGGSNEDWGYGLAVDGAGSVYVTGHTKSSDFAVSLSPYDGSYNGGDADAFVTKLSIFNGIIFGQLPNYSTGSNPNSSSIDVGHKLPPPIRWIRPFIVAANFGSNSISVFKPYSPSQWSEAVNYPVGLQPSFVLARDFTGDGLGDLVVTHWGDNSIMLLRSDDTGLFNDQGTYDVGGLPNAACAADFYENGMLSVAVANVGSNAVSFLRNLGGYFGAAEFYGVGTWPWAICTGDFNGDSRPDVATANNGSNDVSILLNAGGGTFIYPPPAYAVGSGPRSICTGDFNMDGLLDVATANAGSGTITVLLNLGDGIFGGEGTYPTCGSPYAICAADFNADGWIDIATADYNVNSISFLANTQNGTFDLVGCIPAGVGPISVSAGDITDDGRPDLVFANWGSNDIHLLANLTPVVPVQLTGFDAADASLPDEVCPAWSQQTYGGASAPVLADDTLVITTSSNVQNAYYVQTGSEIVPTGALTIEFRMQYVSGATSNSAEGVGMVGISRGDGWHNYLVISYDEVFLWSAEGVRGPVANVDTDDSYHTYRVEVDVAGVIHVYHDGLQILTSALFYHPDYTTPMIWWGDGADNAYGETKWAYFKFNSPGGPCNCCIKGGDANDDGATNIGDAVHLISYIFKSGASPTCLDKGDANSDCTVNVGDAVFLINYIFKGGAAPDCGCVGP